MVRLVKHASHVVEFDILTVDGPVSISVVIVHSIVDPIDQRGWAAYSKIPELQDLRLADAYTSDYFGVDFLIGADLAWWFIRSDDAITVRGLVAQDSSVGYLRQCTRQSCRWQHRNYSIHLPP